MFLIVIVNLVGCVHDKAWIEKKTRRGGYIAYSSSSFKDDSKQVVRDFKKSAKKICGKKRWDIVKEIIPPSGSSYTAVTEASKGNVKGTAMSVGDTMMHERIYRSRRINKKVPVEYGNPLVTYNRALIRCRR